MRLACAAVALVVSMSANDIERALAMARARDTGTPAMSERLALLRDDGGAGFVIFVPVYRAGRTPGSWRAKSSRLISMLLAGHHAVGLSCPFKIRVWLSTEPKPLSVTSIVLLLRFLLLLC